LDARLKDNNYLVGDKYSIADIASFSWVNVSYFAGVDLEQFPNLKKWWERINARPAVQKGLAIPSAPTITNEPYKKKVKDDAEYRQKEDELKELTKKAKEQYNYKYSSP
jgi:glutathione S-transferase